MPVTHKMEYGVLVCGRFDGRFRRDLYISNTGEKVIEPTFATGPNNLSPVHNGMSGGYGGNYDPRCSSCWLHFGHTEDYHRERIASKTTREA